VYVQTALLGDSAKPATRQGENLLQKIERKKKKRETLANSAAQLDVTKTFEKMGDDEVIGVRS
jgi:hypothetical protein